MIDKKIKIEYYDQNEDFAKYLPKTGVIAKQLIDEYRNNDWFLVKIDEPFEYQLKIGENYQYKLIECKNMLIRSRIKNEDIDSPNGTSVFIMLIPDESKLSNNPIKIKDFIHIALGSAKII
ncbi:MAG: hypothetical protein WC317_07815 [Candidatus Omnitrophota bacterium]|jgi:hypothetical protein